MMVSDGVEAPANQATTGRANAIDDELVAHVAPSDDQFAATIG
jgi:hypothetical protein